jgi:hypothetical protein
MNVHGKNSFKLLTRDQFRDAVFTRDDGKCVVCKAPAKDAHHIIERRLWGDGGYYVENGASLCEEHHIEAESTIISCDQLREFTGIRNFPIPEHLYKDQPYDKWGNPIMPNGLRLRGELFNDISVEKILQPVVHLFTDRVKYPRTYHLPWSPGCTNDDRIMNDVSKLLGENVVITAKMDGENTTMYNDYVHARSIEYESHPSRSWVKSLHSRVAHDIPKGWRVCGENLFAEHSIRYNNLDDYFQVFSVWSAMNICLSWDDTIEWASLLGLKTVPVLFRGTCDEAFFRRLYQKSLGGDELEGYVVRLERSFHYKEFKHSVAKYVRENHVTTHGHWMRSQMKQNGLKND